jgi:hypothetical protein
MPDKPDQLRPATADELTDAITFGLRFNGRRRVHYADDSMARIAAEHLAKHLRQSGFVVMRKPPGPSLGEMIGPWKPPDGGAG